MRLASALLFTGLAVSGAHAADYLRGSIPSELPRPTQSASYDWSGFYVGIHGNYNVATMDMSKQGTALANASFPAYETATSLGSLLNFGKPSVRGFGYGGYGGYNVMFDDVVLGLEADYGRVNQTATSNVASLSRQLQSGSAASVSAAARYWDTTYSASARSTLRDYVVFKGRAGVAYDRFMPYATFGIALGRISTTTNGSGTTQQYESQPVHNPATGDITGYNRINLTGVIPGVGTTKTDGNRWGFAGGLGMEYALLDNLLLRAEWQYLSFGGPSGTHNTLNTVKGGVAAKF